MTSVRDSTRPMSCNPLTHRDVERMTVRNSSLKTYDCHCCTCDARWVESEWVS